MPDPHAAEGDAPNTLPGDWHKHPGGYVHDDSFSQCLALGARPVVIDGHDAVAALRALGYHVTPPAVAQEGEQ